MRNEVINILKDLKKKKRDFELKTSSFINEESQKFYDETGISIVSLDVYFIESNVIGMSEPVITTEAKTSLSLF